MFYRVKGYTVDTVRVQRKRNYHPSYTERPYPYVSIVASRDDFVFSKNEAGNSSRMTHKRRHTSTVLIFAIVAGPNLQGKTRCVTLSVIIQVTLDSGFRTLMVRSWLPLTSLILLQATVQTPSRCPKRVRTALPESMSHSFIVLSRLPETSSCRCFVPLWGDDGRASSTVAAAKRVANSSQRRSSVGSSQWSRKSIFKLCT